MGLPCPLCKREITDTEYTVDLSITSGEDYLIRGVYICHRCAYKIVRIEHEEEKWNAWRTDGQPETR
jgi:hypothetical protein